MNSAANQETNVKVSSGKEDFWKQHAVLQKGSGLSRAEYCRKTQLNYACFRYWLKNIAKANFSYIDICSSGHHGTIVMYANFQARSYIKDTR